MPAPEDQRAIQFRSPKCLHLMNSTENGKRIERMIRPAWLRELPQRIRIWAASILLGRTSGAIGAAFGAQYSGYLPARRRTQGAISRDTEGFRGLSLPGSTPSNAQWHVSAMLLRLFED